MLLQENIRLFILVDGPKISNPMLVLQHRLRKMLVHQLSLILEMPFLLLICLKACKIRDSKENEIT